MTTAPEIRRASLRAVSGRVVVMDGHHPMVIGWLPTGWISDDCNCQRHPCPHIAAAVSALLSTSPEEPTPMTTADDDAIAQHMAVLNTLLDAVRANRDHDRARLLKAVKSVDQKWLVPGLLNLADVAIELAAQATGATWRGSRRPDQCRHARRDHRHREPQARPQGTDVSDQPSEPETVEPLTSSAKPTDQPASDEPEDRQTRRDSTMRERATKAEARASRLASKEVLRALSVYVSSPVDALVLGEVDPLDFLDDNDDVDVDAVEQFAETISKDRPWLRRTTPSPHTHADLGTKKRNVVARSTSWAKVFRG